MGNAILVLFTALFSVTVPKAKITLRLFKESVKPIWEDPANIGGGKWTISQSSKNAKKNFELTDALCLWESLALIVAGATLGHLLGGQQDFKTHGLVLKNTKFGWQVR